MIVILVVIALISTPIIIGVIDKARRGAFEDSAYGVLDAAKLYFTSKLADDNAFAYTEFDFAGDMKDFKLSGDKPAGGFLLIDTDGTEALAMYDKDHKWCAVKNFAEEKIRIIDNYKKCDKEVAENLVINGYGEYGDTTNFEDFTYIKEEDAYSVSNETRELFTSQKFIPIDPDATYEVSAELKCNNSTSEHYSGVAEYDVDQKIVNNFNANYIRGTLTELVRDLKDGDTVVYLKDATNWLLEPSYPASPTINRGLIFWNYKDSTGHQYGPNTYSKNIWFPLYEFTGVDKANSIITLNSPWNHGTFEAGTPLSQSNSGSQRNYVVARAPALTSTYQNFEGTISGYGTDPDVYTKFRQGTKYMRFHVFANYNNTSNTTLSVKNIVIKKVHG